MYESESSKRSKTDATIHNPRSIVILGELTRGAVISDALGDDLRKHVIAAASASAILQYASESASPAVILDSSMENSLGTAEDVRKAFPRALILLLLDMEPTLSERNHFERFNLKPVNKPFNATRFRLNLNAHFDSVESKF